MDLVNKAEIRKADSDYQRHHFVCSICVAASKGAIYGARCASGERLWETYVNDIVPMFVKSFSPLEG